MNRDRRKALAAIRIQLYDLHDLLEEVQQEEEEYRDNIPENLQGSERYEKADEACDNLYSAISSLEEVIEYIDAAVE